MEPKPAPPLSPPALPTTSTTLLAGLRGEQNETLWREYVDRYRPLIVSFARRLGLAEDAAEDVAQASLIAFSEGYRAGRYDRGRGRLRSWLFGIVHNQVRNWHRRRPPDEAFPATTAFDQLEAPGELEPLWEEEWHRSVLARCTEAARGEFEPTTFAAFRRYAVDEVPAEEVARELGISVNAVYGAKRRVLRRIRELTPLIEEIW